MENFTIENANGHREFLQFKNINAAKSYATKQGFDVTYSVKEENGKRHTRERWNGANTWGFRCWKAE